ncbi:MAG: TetR/AcrR family transcriptional regulator [Sulfitobacter sp.]
MTSTRLTLDDWLLAGFDALQRSGQSALAAEPLARALGTTKGSFYWHFKDVSAYHVALIDNWQGTAMAAMVDLLKQDGTADQRLRNFGAELLNDRAESSMRVWGQTNPQVAEALRKVDAERMTYLVTLLRQLGLGNPDFARALLAVLVGLPQLSQDAPSRRTATFDVLVDTVLALSQ